MLYFAYGSNMMPWQMRERCPGAVARGIARLPGHRVTFVRDRYGFASGVPTIVRDATESVWGVLWELPEEDVPALDVWEAHPIAYRRESVGLLAPGPVVAWAYVATSTAPRAPSKAFFRSVALGAEAFALPREYQRRLRRWAHQDR